MFSCMEVGVLFYFLLLYLVLVLLVVLAGKHRRISLFKTFIISFLLTPAIGILALYKSSRKVVVTHYKPLIQCPNCPFIEEQSPQTCESCKFIEKMTNKLSIERKYLI